MAGYIFGKYGSDILMPAALAKAISKSMKGAQELNIVYKRLLLESVSGLENSMKIAEIVQLE